MHWQYTILCQSVDWQSPFVAINWTFYLPRTSRFCGLSRNRYNAMIKHSLGWPLEAWNSEEFKCATDPPTRAYAEWLYVVWCCCCCGHLCISISIYLYTSIKLYNIRLFLCSYKASWLNPTSFLSKCFALTLSPARLFLSLLSLGFLTLIYLLFFPGLLTSCFFFTDMH